MLSSIPADLIVLPNVESEDALKYLKSFLKTPGAYEHCHVLPEGKLEATSGLGILSKVPIAHVSQLPMPINAGEEGARRTGQPHGTSVILNLSRHRAGVFATKLDLKLRKEEQIQYIASLLKAVSQACQGCRSRHIVIGDWRVKYPSQVLTDAALNTPLSLDEIQREIDLYSTNPVVAMSRFGYQVIDCGSLDGTEYILIPGGTRVECRRDYSDVIPTSFFPHPAQVVIVKT